MLRIEDTDQERFTEGAEAYIHETLKWCGIMPDESPWQPGSRGPYRQSERKASYRAYAEQLVAEDKAYYAFDTADELDAIRKQYEQRKETFFYNAATRIRLKNALTLPPEEVKARIEAGEPYVIRLKIPPKDVVIFEDIIRGTVKVYTHTLDDKVLMKSDGMPTYHLANIVDDHLMGITHVIRGEEWLPSAPMHVLMYKFFGWEATMPQFAHLPLLLKPSGQGKLSKRDGDQHGFPVFPLLWKDPATGAVSQGFREIGFLPEALLNFLALLGWNPGTEQELFDLAGLAEAFSLERINKSGTKFDFEKAKWFNQHYLKHAETGKLAGYLVNGLASDHGIACPEEKATHIVALLRERITFLTDLVQMSLVFFEVPAHYDEGLVKKRWTPEVAQQLGLYANRLEQQQQFTAEEAKQWLEELLAEAGIGLGKVMLPLRVALTGMGAGPDLMPVVALLGGEETAARIRKATTHFAQFLPL
jgi:glutamyl-tRNA synthetase